MTISKNMCKCEQIARIVIGVILTSLAFWGPQSLWFLLGLIPVVTGAIGYCPLYPLIHRNGAASCSTGCCCCKPKDKKEE